MFDPKLAIEWLTAKQALCLEMELPLTELVAELYEYVDQFSEQDLSGLADFLALYAEQLESLEDDQLKLVTSVIQRLSLQLTQLFNTSPELTALELVSCLKNSQWPEPLPEEDGELLFELLEQDCCQLSSVTPILDDTNAEELEESTPLDEQAIIESTVTEGHTASSQEEDCVELEASASVLNAFPSLFALLQQIGESLPQFSEEHTEKFYEEIDVHSENDWSGISDLLALYGELLVQLEELESAPFANKLNSAILALLAQPADEQVKAVLTLMSDSQWPEPVAQEDTEFLYDLLIEDIERLNSAASFEENLTEISSDEQPLAPIELIKEVIDVPNIVDDARATSLDVLQQTNPEALKPALPEAPAFCSIDFTLLQQEGPQIEPAVIMMLSQSVSALSGQWHEASTERSILDESSEILSTVIRALETINLIGVKVLVNGLILNLQYLQEYDIDLSVEIIESIQACLSGLEEYFVDISIYERQQTLLDQFLDTQLPCKPNTEQGSFIMGLLALASLQRSEDIEQETATPEDIELHESGDIDPQLLDMLHNELPTLCDDFLSQLQQAFTHSDEEALRSAKRAVHTLKGLANMAGIKGLANLAHRLEDVMEYLTDADKLPTGRLQADFLEAADCLAVMSETVTEGASAPDNGLQVLQSIMDWDYRFKTDGLKALDACNDIAGSASSNIMVENPASEESAENSPNEETTAESARNESPVFRVQRSVLDNLFRLAGESSTLNTQLDEEVTQLRGFTRNNRERHRILQRVLFELEQQFHEQMNVQSQLDENSEDFDPLEMDRYNEIHTTISRVHEAVADVREVQQEMEGHIQSLSSLHMAQSSLQKETLTNVLSTRLVPIKTITSRLQRILRQACRATDKQASLVIKGEDTQVDSQILNQLADPLMHIIRNAVDHGLETARLRQQRGKPAEGVITLTFSMQDSLIDVKCEDDGDGINAQRVLAVAQEKSLIEPDIDLSDDEVNRLILIPGFSTRGEVSQLSGRGIGMDVVYQQILKLQGTLNIESRPREGTLFHLSMPASSLMIRTLLVRCAKQVFALAGHGVEQSLISLDGQLQKEGDDLTFHHGNESYPVYMLESLVDERGYNYFEEGAVHPILIINMAQGERVALLVKEVIAHRELAFKQMSDFVPDIPGLPGLTILANGETAPIVDLPSRIRYLRSSLYEKPLVMELETEIELPRLLVVDDSLSARKTLETLLKDTGYEVMTAIDGLDALNQVRKRQPDIVITDMEMPRMGGVELSTVLSNRDETRDIPVIMITSRSTEKHRNEALEAGISAYLTKPWSENQLLDQIDNLLAETCV